MCVHCEDPEEIEGRDNRLLKHLANYKACPNLPQNIRSDAFTALQGKLKSGPVENTLASPSVPAVNTNHDIANCHIPVLTPP